MLPSLYEAGALNVSLSPTPKLTADDVWQVTPLGEVPYVKEPNRGTCATDGR